MSSVSNNIFLASLTSDSDKVLAVWAGLHRTVGSKSSVPTIQSLSSPSQIISLISLGCNKGVVGLNMGLATYLSSDFSLLFR